MTTNIKKRLVWTEKEVSLLKEIYATCTVKALLDAFPNRPHYSICTKAFQLKLSKTVNNRRKFGNLTPLLEDNLEAFYWVGFIFADGYINHERDSLSLELMQDVEQLEKYALFIKGKVRHTEKRTNILNSKREVIRKEQKPLFIVTVGDEIVVPKLIKKFDFRPRKTYNPPSVRILKRVLNTKEKFLSFLIGFIDGDGNIEECGTIGIKNHSTWLRIHLYFYQEMKKYGLVTGHKNVKIMKDGYSRIRFNGNLLITYVREHFPFAMKRKWFKAEHILRMETHKKIFEMHRRGMSVKEIANSLNISPSSIAKNIQYNTFSL